MARARVRLAAFLFLAAALAGAIPTPSQAQVPANNTCGQNQASFTIPTGGGIFNGSLQFATNDGVGCGVSGSPDVYYYITPSATGFYRCSTCAAFTVNTQVSVHTACPTNFANVWQGACNDDFGGCNGGSQLDVNLQAGVLYVIRVATFPGGGQPTYAFTLSVQPNPFGTCCLPSGQCANMRVLDCASQNGTVQTAGTVCSPNPCPQPGACCNTLIGGCNVTLPAACAGTHLGAGTTCSPNPCIGRCCIRTCCTSTLREDCTSGSWLLQQTCTSSPCPPPVNDNCSTALSINPASLPVSILFGNCSATDDVGDPCAYNGAANSHNNLWWSITPTVSGNYCFDTCASTVTDTVLALYTTPDCTTLTTIACLDDQFNSLGWACGPGLTLRSRIYYSLTAGTRYYIHVGSWWDTTPNVGDITLSVSAPAAAGACCQSLSGVCLVAPGAASCTGTFNFMGAGSLCTPTACDGAPNDACTNAEPLCLDVIANGTTRNARSDGTASCDLSMSPSPDVWYSYVPAQSGRVVLDVLASGFEPVVGVWTGSCPGAVEISCRNQFGSNYISGQFDVVAGVRYLIRVAGYGNQYGSFQIGMGAITGTPGCGNIAGPGACCPGDNSCASTTQAACGGTWTSGGTCSPNPCPQFPGACCTAGACSFTTPANCAGAFQGAGIACSPTPCIGACCIPGACSPISIDRASCAGTWTNCTQNCGCGAPPPNDLCANAIALTLNQTESGDNCTAASDWPGCFGTPPAHTLWYSFTPSTGGYYLFDLCGSTVDPSLILLVGNCNGSPVTCGTLEAAPEAGCADRTSFMFDAPLTAGVSYYVIVSSYGPDGDPAGPGAFTLVVRSIETGACCHGPSSTCEIKSAAGCGFGAAQPADFQFLGVGTTCSPSNPCLNQGACCISPTQCELRYQTLCDYPNLYISNGSACQPTNPCDSAGACCHGNGSCSLRLAAQCQTPPLVFLGPGSTCGSAQCPPLGACCFDNLSTSCQMSTQVGCEGFGVGVWFGAASTCATTDCSAPGACCLTGGNCLPGAPSICLQVAGPGAFQGFGVPCTPTPCMGACCTGTHCTTTSSASCAGSWQGTASACGPVGNPTTCCPANFNGQGGIGVQDIFDFLAAYFANSLAADFNQSGTIGVQDIFDFLAAYFAGCS